jgi:N-acetylglucosaminyldiphosphoundecaprenol N-acetyl-beta-D-mannosaminyltransferase
MQMHMHQIGYGVGIGVGAAFDLLAGVKKQAPRWIQRSGLEWAFRLAMEPKRLLKRYAVVVPLSLVFMLERLVKGEIRTARN